MIREREYLGRGTEHRIWRIGPDSVAKFACSPFLLHPSHKLDRTGTRVKERVRRDIQTLEYYVGDEFLMKESIKGLADVWWVTQERLNSRVAVSSETITDGIKQDVSLIARRAWRMYEDTGLAFDWFGLEIFSLLTKLSLDQNYWVLPNLLLVDGKVRICDNGLIFTRLGAGAQKNQGPVLSRIETIPWWPITRFLLRVMGKRSSIKLSGF
jgi:hypothetical protein